MKLRKSIADDIEELVFISKNAFDSDIEVGCEEAGGPPYYDSVQWHKQMAEENHLYTYLNDEDEIVGGAILFENKDCLFIGRIFINTKYFRCGYGMKLMELIEKMFSHLKCVKLDTPVWNVRTNNFYKKCGYTEISRDEESVYYIKEI